uniref:Metal ABC transporter ATP-binding protein n=1 Tax=Staphylothermus marinus TaxID=2280 RepID=A0A7C4D8K4_STAMA
MLRLVIENLSVAYGDEIVLSDLNFEFNGYGIIQVIGPNGAGKTTLLKTIAGLIKPIKGRVILESSNSSGRRVSIGYVPQDTSNIPMHYPVTVYDYVASSFSIKKRWPRLKLNSLEKEIVENALSRVELNPREWFKSLSELSGGEKQRVLIARCLVLNPSVILLDEPFSNVDRDGRFKLAKLVSELSKEKLFIIANHDPYLLIDKTDSILMINRKEYFYGKPRDVLVRDKIVKIYGPGVVEKEFADVFILDSCGRF